MALNVSIQVYRGTLASLGSLATTTKAGVLAWTTDTNQMFVDAGSGAAGIGAGKAWQPFASNVTVSTAANLAARTALAAKIGDIAKQTDTSTTYILTALPASTDANWVAIGLSTAPVTSVAGRTGAVTLTMADVSGALPQGQLPATLGAGSSLTVIDAGVF